MLTYVTPLVENMQQRSGLIASTAGCTDGLECPFPKVNPGYMSRTDAPLKVYKCVSTRDCPGALVDGSPSRCGANREPNSIACDLCDDESYKSGTHFSSRRLFPHVAFLKRLLLSLKDGIVLGGGIGSPATRDSVPLHVPYILPICMLILPY